MLPVRIVLLAGAGAVCSHASAQQVDWLTQFGTSSEDGAWGAVTDGAGGAYACGYTDGALGTGGVSPRDGWVARLDSQGARLWTRQISSTFFDYAYGIASDGAGGVFVGGETYGALSPPALGNGDFWLARYDSAGARLWIRQFGTSAVENGGDLAPDGAGGVYFTGTTGGALPGPQRGGLDVVVGRYDSGGALLWVRQFGSASGDIGYAVSPDGQGGVLVGGVHDGDGFFAHYDAAGSQSWLRQIGGGFVYGVAPDGAGGAIVGGATSGNLGGPNAGRSDAWTARYNAAGNRLWVSQFGTAENDLVFDAAPDGRGGAFVSGHYGGFLPVGQDAWIFHFDDAGDRTLAWESGSSGNTESARTIEPDGAGGFIASGTTNGVLGASNFGGQDAWVARFDAPCYADCDANQTLDIFDFLCFQDAFVATAPYADCDGNSVFDVFDFLCFQDAFVVGCP